MAFREHASLAPFGEGGSSWSLNRVFAKRVPKFVRRKIPLRVLKLKIVVEFFIYFLSVCEDSENTSAVLRKKSIKFPPCIGCVKACD